jgi:putative acetyltransferase
MVCLQFRSNDQDDLEVFLKRMYEARGMEYEPDGLHSDFRNVEEIYLSRGNFWVIRETQERKIIGSIGLKELDRNNEIGELKRFFVLPEYQGSGYGRLLMTTAITYARENEYKKLRLDTMKQATKAQAIFRVFGFYEIPRYNNNNMADYFFELLL